jgi:hypothetical protein
MLLFSVLFGLLAATQAQGAVIAITPSTQIVFLGTQAIADVTIAGLGSGSAPSVGTFDVSVEFDPSLLSFVSVSFGDQLDILGLGSIQSVLPGVGTVNLFEVSLDTSDDLNSLQRDEFVLATLIFDSVATGTSPLTLTLNALGDAQGQALPATVENGSVTIPTPEPGQFLPIAALFLGIGIHRSKRLLS